MEHMQERTSLSPLVVIAGNGDFPRALIEEASSQGIRVSAVCHIGETKDEIANLVDSLIWIKVGQLGKIISFLKKVDAASAVFTGGISRVKLFDNFQPDLKTLALIARVGSVRDDVILRAIAEEVEKAGVRVIASGDILKRCVARKGILTKRNLTKEELADVEIGWQAAKKLGELDLGQTAVVSNGLVVALECVEGTDEAIRRGGVLARGSRLTIVKTAKPQQDLRLDLPSIGVQTVEFMKQSGATALILEHERAMILDPGAFVEAANKANIAVVVINDIVDLSSVS